MPLNRPSGLGEVLVGHLQQDDDSGGSSGGALRSGRRWARANRHSPYAAPEREVRPRVGSKLAI
eukprot:5150328-Prymnesium_polylepis.1